MAVTFLCNLEVEFDIQADNGTVEILIEAAPSNFEDSLENSVEIITFILSLFSGKISRFR